MLIALTEGLGCPVCLAREGQAPPQGLVAFAEVRSGGWVRRGSLGCVVCETRFPIERGVIDFGSPARQPASAQPASGRPSSGRASSGGAGGGAASGSPAPDAVALAALLGLDAGSAGVVLVGEGLGTRALALAALAGGIRVLALHAAAPAPEVEEGSDGAVTRAYGVPPAVLPLLSGRLRGVALLGGPPARVREAARALAPGGRLTVLRPSEEARAAVEGLPLRLLAADARALVAVRE